MAKGFRIVFRKPLGIIGRLVIWRTKDLYSHSWIELDGIVYDPYPIWSKRYILSKKLRDKKFRSDLTIELDLSRSEKQLMRAWAEDWVGTRYDFLAIIGWLLGVDQIENNRNSYCHEFCRHALVRLGRLPAENSLITARQLEKELLDLGGKIAKD